MTGVFPARSQRAISSSSGVRALAPVDQEQGDVRLAHRGLGLLAHSARQRVRVFVLIARRIHHSEFEPKQLPLALAAVARDAGTIVHQRQSFADKTVEQGRFADVGPADDRYGGKAGH